MSGQLTVVAPIDDTPASQAGIEAGDVIIKLDDTFIKGPSLDQAGSVCAVLKARLSC